MKKHIKPSQYARNKGDMQIVVFSPHKLINNSADGMWSLIDKVQPKSSLLPPFNKLVTISNNF